jgi:4,5-DOPA dioxygenase extradiol
MKERMPALFVGHGSPMNAIEENSYSRTWSKLGKELKRPEVILVISAHWYTNGLRISNTTLPKMVYDMYGFPEALYRVKYAAKGSPETACLVEGLTGSGVRIDNSWGIDHGAWSVLCNMYPDADIPVLQLSVDASSDAYSQYMVGKQLAPLRDQGVMILGSGNVVHNLARLDWDQESGFPWALDFDQYIKSKIISGEYDAVIDYKKAGDCSKDAFTTPEHFHPLLTILGASGFEDRLAIFNESCVMGSLSMTSYLWNFEKIII